MALNQSNFKLFHSGHQQIKTFLSFLETIAGFKAMSKETTIPTASIGTNLVMLA